MRLADGTSGQVLEAEEAVIAACLLDCDCHESPADPDGCAYILARQVIERDDIRSEALRWCWDGITRLHSAGEPVTVITLADDLERHGRLDEIGAEPAIQEIIGRWFTALGVQAHARIIKRDSERRKRLAELGKEAARVGRGEFGLRGVAAKYRDEL